MRLRHSVAAGLGALALALAVPATAGAATGHFSYLYETPGGTTSAVLVDPPSRECVNLPEVAHPWQSPAHSPRNRTASTAVAFSGPDCTGRHFSMRPMTGYASERLEMRSVLFS